jgi:type II restriction enzyme
MSEQFITFLSELSESNATLDYFTDFEKIIKNTDKISIKLNQLNYLLGKDDLKKGVEQLFKENPKVFEVLDILIAVRTKDKKKTINFEGEIVFLESYFQTTDKIVEFIENTGLGDVFRNKNITNLVDYVFGIEVGLDTNARKNRGGTNMEKAVALIFDGAEIFYKKEVYNTIFPEITGFGEDLKRFDFVVKTKSKTYLIETNYYNGGGSKLNEVARSYSIVAPKINQFSHYEFVWITDGQGWNSAKNKLEEAFYIIPSVYNLNSIKKFIDKVKEEGIVEF